MKKTIGLACGALALLGVSQTSFAIIDSIPPPSSDSHFYVGGNLGLSDLYDNPSTPTNSVQNSGVGWGALFGYQINKYFGAEMGYTDYANSKEVSGGATQVNETEHYAVHLAVTGQYPLYNHIYGLIKLGAAYSYARRVFTGGAFGEEDVVGIYSAIGLIYRFSDRIDGVVQWAIAWGNDTDGVTSSTGSSSLYSIGLNVAIN